MLVIHPDECIDCGVCEPECPPEAILPDSEPGAEKWLELNRQMSEIWPNIGQKIDSMPDAEKCGTRLENTKNISPKRQVLGPSAPSSFLCVDRQLLANCFLSQNQLYSELAYEILFGHFTHYT